MKKIVTLTAAVGLACAGAAMADQYADQVVGSTGVSAHACCDDPNDALGAPDAAGNNLGDFTGFVTLVDTGTLTVNFTDNVCFENGSVAPDLQVHEYLGTEPFDVAVGLAGNLLTTGASGSGNAGETIDLGGVISGQSFNQVKVTSTSDGGTVPGADIDALECLWTLDQNDIVKTHTGLQNIDVGTGALQTGFSFTIAITNNTGIDNAFAGLTFFDSVPGEFDLDTAAEDASDGTTDTTCTDGICDGVEMAGNCSVTPTNPQGAIKKGLTKLEPEHLPIDAGELLSGETCTLTVWAKTDAKTFPKGRSPAFAPTSCPRGTITLNDGVNVFDASKNLLLQDDDTLDLICN